MRILWVCGSAVLGGAERATLHVSRRLQGLGHEVTVLCRAGGPVARAARDAGLTVRSDRFGEGLNLRGGLSLHRALRASATDAVASATDAVLVTTIPEWLWAGVLVGRPTALVLARFMVLPLPLPLLWLARQRADAIVAVSEAVRQSLLRRGALPADLVHVIPGPARFAPRTTVPTGDERKTARTALGLSGSGHWVGFCGGLAAAKGVDDVLRVIATANRMVGSTHVVVCGRDAGAGSIDRLHASARAHGLEGRVHYLGEVERIDDVMTAVDVVVMATHSRLGEALPLTLIEAMGCGTPVAAYAVGGVSEVIGDDGSAGRLAQPDEPESLARVLIEILGNQAEAARLATNALGRVRLRFDPEQAARSYEKLFLSLRSRQTGSRNA